MRLAELKDRLSSFDSDVSGYASRQVLLYEACLMFFDELDYSIGHPDLLLGAEQTELLEFFLENLQPRSATPDERVYRYLLNHLTPKLFLSQENFDRVKIFFYKKLSTSKDAEQCYQDPCHLTDLGRLRVYAELMRIEFVYEAKFARVFNSDTKLYEPLLSQEVARALYLYMTNFFTKINGPLRSGGMCDCTIRHFVYLINIGINRLSRVPAFQLNPDEHMLTRYITLPEEILKRVIKDIRAMNCFLDRAFLSTSFNKEGAVDFAAGANVVIVIHSNGDCRGAKVNELSPFPNEGECLYPPGTKFECRSMEECNDTMGSSKWIIHVSAVSLASTAVSAIAALKAASKFKTPLTRRHSLSPSVLSAADKDKVVSRRFTLPELAVAPVTSDSKKEALADDVHLPLLEKKFYVGC